MEAAISPSIISEKNSAEPKRRANPAIIGVKAARQMIAKQLPQNDATVVMKIAEPALPLRAMGWPSKQMTDADGEPGTLSKIDVIDPPY